MRPPAAQLNLVHTGAVGNRTVPSCSRRDCPRKVDVPHLQPEHTAGQPHAETVVGDRQERP
jgi:hypothetical protein